MAVKTQREEEEGPQAMASAPKNKLSWQGCCVRETGQVGFIHRGSRDHWSVSVSLTTHMIPNETNATLLAGESDTWLPWIPYVAGTVCGGHIPVDLDRVQWKCSVRSKFHPGLLTVTQRLAWER